MDGNIIYSESKKDGKTDMKLSIGASRHLIEKFFDEIILCVSKYKKPQIQ